MTVSGTVDGTRLPFVVEAVEAGNAGPSLAKVWARANIAELADRQATTGDPHGELGDAIRRIALQHQLASDYTSFVAVDSIEPTAGEYGVDRAPGPCRYRRVSAMRRRWREMERENDGFPDAGLHQESV